MKGKEEPCAPDLVPPDLVPHPPGRHKVGTRSTMNGERPYIYIYIIYIYIYIIYIYIYIIYIYIFKCITPKILQKDNSDNNKKK